MLTLPFIMVTAVEKYATLLVTYQNSEKPFSSDLVMICIHEPLLFEC